MRRRFPTTSRLTVAAVSRRVSAAGIGGTTDTAGSATGVNYVLQLEQRFAAEQGEHRPSAAHSA